MEFELGKVGASILITIMLKLVYGTWAIADRAKPWIAIGLGVALAIVSIFYTADAMTFRNVVDHLVQGFMVGATAVGLNELMKKERTT